MSCLLGYPALKKIFQLRMLSTISLLAQSMAVADLPRGSQLIPEIVPLQRCSHDTDILYSCAIALKLAPVWQLEAFEIANQLVTALGENLYDSALGIHLNFSVEVVSSGWIYFRLQEQSLATWLQQSIVQGDRRGGEGEIGGATADNDNFFPMQYAHARCCSLLRLAHRQGLIELSDANCTTLFPLPWLKDAQGMEGKVLRLRLVHPAERRLIAQIVDVQDALSNHSQLQLVKLARDLSQAFEEFYRSCRIWGEVKSQTPQLAQARLGLVAVTQILLRSLLQEHLGIFAPMQL